MKYSSGLLVASAALALAQPHVHGHRHLHAHKARDVQTAYEKITVTVYELNGRLIPEAEVQQGIANGTLIWGDEEGEIEVASVEPVSIQTPEIKKLETPAPTPTPTPTPTPEYTPEPVPSSSAAPVTSEPEPEPSKSQSSYGGYSGSGDFPDYDNSLSCDEFPSAFGALEVDYLGLGKWIGIQSPGYSGLDGLDLLHTATKDTCTGPDCCKEGAYCSYACPAGYQKTQWPSTQGKTKQSIGGLLCKDGKLTLTRGDVTKKLCDKGTSAIQVKVKNNMGKGAAICRTDYPGTESETVPTWVSAGGTADLACPDAANYYEWDGASTSAQLYVNPAGTPLEEACQWGDSSNPYVGNWAPLNIGVGYKDGKGWMSLFRNFPTTTTKLDFSIKITGDDISDQSCKYDAGKQQYYSDALQWNDLGCTVAVNSGTVWFEFE